MRQLTKTMCVEWAEHNIQANAIGPGYFRTELNRALWSDEAFNKWVHGADARRPLGRTGGADRRCGLPRLRRLGFHERADDLRRRRVAGVDVRKCPRLIPPAAGSSCAGHDTSARCRRKARRTSSAPGVSLRRPNFAPSWSPSAPREELECCPARFPRPNKLASRIPFLLPVLIRRKAAMEPGSR